jgi:hypothetical protein
MFLSVSSRVKFKESLHVLFSINKDGNGDPHILLTISKVNFYNLTFLDLGKHIKLIKDNAILKILKAFLQTQILTIFH